VVRRDGATVREPFIVNLVGIEDARGSLRVVEDIDVGFPIRRVFFMYGKPGMKRGEHAHHRCHEVVVPVSGAVTIWTDDGHERRAFRLESPAQGLHLPPNVWRVLEDFTDNTVCVVLASMNYDAADYIRNYQVFIESVRGTTS